MLLLYTDKGFQVRVRWQGQPMEVATLISNDDMYALRLIAEHHPSLLIIEEED